MKQQTEEQKARLRKFLLVLPVIIVFCAALIFTALGGGKGKPSDQANNNQGINTQLPDAKFGKEHPQDKLSLYDEAAKDSVRSKSNANNPLFSLNGNSLEKHPVYPVSADASAAKINQKLLEIGRVINSPALEAKPLPPHANDKQPTPETEKLEKMLAAINSKDAEDPDLKQLNAMLDKIAAIQSPPKADVPTNAPTQKNADSTFKAIPAVIEGDQKIAQGGVVKLRSLDTIIIKNVIIPKGQLLFGSCNITNQRLLLDIKNIRLGTSIVPVSFSVYSLDGLPGIDAPEAELAEAGGMGTANAVQSMDFLPMDQSLGIQAASAGINAAKTLISKKVKKIKVKLHGGQQVLLRINKN
ncbi:conjugative transposon protein TraM [Mucilaginibacter sp. R-33]|uniref:conjugative transposon protein TraM n=1 Tax=Mucilaginibacter sp. R-33 TaxID=3416711 RepID=UPI003CE6CF6C